VDLYVGGAEHATRHLIYARFWHKFLYDIGTVSDIEPFRKLRSVGLIMGEDGRKMSKRFGNVINPDDLARAVGADSLRLYEMFMGPFDQSIAWSTSSIAGTRRFVERVWKLKEKINTKHETLNPKQIQNTKSKIINRTVKKVGEDIEAMRFNTAISAMMIALNEIEKEPSVSPADYETLVGLLAPFAPHVTEEIWSSLGHKSSIHESQWPVHDLALDGEEMTSIVVQVNGKVRASFTTPPGTGKDELERIAVDLPEVKKWLQGKAARKVIVVPDRLVSIVSG
jgi:leucyl-tRNA synthetase